MGQAIDDPAIDDPATHAVIQGDVPILQRVSTIIKEAEPPRAGRRPRSSPENEQWRPVQLLLEAGADANQATTNNSASPLLIAASQGHLEIDRLLPDGADQGQAPAISARCKSQLGAAAWRFYNSCSPLKGRGKQLNRT